MKNIHGHEVLQMMCSSGKTYTTASLTADIVERFGADARFHTCSAEDMSAEELVEFLHSKGKFIPTGEGFQTSPDRICSH
jgi:probable metal-binding protein